jgi:hypothetical protein
MMTQKSDTLFGKKGITTAEVSPQLMYRVPVLTYLSLAGEVRLNEFKLKHQRVHDGYVLFETPREIERITQLIEAHNTGVPMPFSEVEYDGPALVEHLDILKGVKRMNEEWYSSQCPSCVVGGRDNKMNNLQFSRMGFRCMSGCAGRDVLAEFTKMLPVNVEVELERGQTTLDIPAPKEEGKRRVMKVDEDGMVEFIVNKTVKGFDLTIITTKKASGNKNENTHKVSRSALRRLWVWLTKNYPAGEMIEGESIREFMAEIYGVPVKEWGGYGPGRSIYMKNHYYPLKILQYQRCIEHHPDGSVTLLSTDFENPSTVLKEGLE